MTKQSREVSLLQARRKQESKPKMIWQFSIRNAIYPKERYIWAPVRIIHETEKAILIDNGRKIWVPKSRIYGVRLRNNTFEIYTQESAIG